MSMSKPLGPNMATATLLGPPKEWRRSSTPVLIGCVRTKKAVASPASELFASPLFEGRRRYAAGSGQPWYILSAKFGLLGPR
jgi:hypothetical protein